MLRYCIHNKESLDNMRKFLAPDTFKTPESMRENPILTVNFFQKYILSNVEIIVHDVIGDKKEFLSQQLRKHYISPNDRNLFPKIQEFIYYRTASEFIKIMLHYKGEPKFKVKNEQLQMKVGRTLIHGISFRVQLMNLTLSGTPEWNVGYGLVLMKVCLLGDLGQQL
jgi:hypothetical protein